MRLAGYAGPESAKSDKEVQNVEYKQLHCVHKPIHKLAKKNLEGSRRYLLDSCTNIQYVPPGRTVLVQVLFCT
eukprot:SAG11_NODE_9107_length_942_cov_2.185053_2_plen_72_part_01